MAKDLKEANTTYRYGSTGSGVKELQNKLIAAGYDVGNDGANGVFGNATAAAVKEYQKDHGLAVDGVAGKNTLGSLNSNKGSTKLSTAATQGLSTLAKSAVNAGKIAAGATPDFTTVTAGSGKPATKNTKTPSASSGSSSSGSSSSSSSSSDGFTFQDFTYDPFAPSDLVNQAHGLLQEHEANKPGDYTPVWQDEADAYLSQYQNRDPFSYNYNNDALYQQYKDTYINQGRMAMMDTMGQAAALTGGYGNSYAQTAGQQAYNQQLSQLNDIIPELSQMARAQYDQEGQHMLDMYDLYMMREQNERSKYQEDYDRWYQTWGMLNSNYNDLYDREYNEYLNDVNMSHSAYLLAREDARNDYEYAREMEYQRERDKIADQQWQKQYELSKNQSNNNRSYYSYGDYGDTGYVGDTVGTVPAGGNQVSESIISRASSLGSNADLENYLDGLVASKVITEAQADSLYAQYRKPDQAALSNRSWQVVDKGGINWFGGLDRNATVKDQYGNTYSTVELRKALEADGMSKSEAKSYVENLQKRLGI